MNQDSLQQVKTEDASFILPTYGRYPLVVSRAEGSRLYTPEGREYVDLLAGIAVTSLGHSHPEVVEAACRAGRSLVHVSNLFYQPSQIALARELASSLPGSRVFFCNSGAEANEAAVKLARRYMRAVRGEDRDRIVTLEGSFHGRTLAALTATGQPPLQEHFHPLPGGFESVPFGDVESLARAVDENCAAVLVEAVQGESGVRPLGRDYAAAIQDICREKGALLMVDEVQAGLCRTGRFWAFEHFGLTPDVVTSAKALANGLPMGALLATEPAALGFSPGSHATTFGGGGMVCAAAAKVLEIMRRDGLAERAGELGSRALGLFEDMRRRHPEKIAEVRGMGLMVGIELAFDGRDVWAALLEAGFVCNLAKDRTLRLLPALTIDFADIQDFARTLEDILTAG